ncbi:MAG TPA: D-tyrosyl-tRNA(Tyr) deacylase [Candidatus Scatomonas merdavium]|nr:D-tyrosyl-tRNA(Tyr) deacylase [Candidatus Scatomonas merdavium]
MKFVIQRVGQASVKVDGKIVGAIQKGYLVLIGVGREDTEADADKYLKKLLGLRIFEDEQGKTNLSLADVDGELLLVSQFTLYANCRKGNRPSFIEAGAPEQAERLYQYIVSRAREQVPVVETGVFGASMEVSLVNEGPFTILLENL